MWMLSCGTIAARSSRSILVPYNQENKDMLSVPICKAARAKGWKIVEDVARSRQYSISDLRIVRVHLKGEISGHELRENAKKKSAMMGVQCAQYLLDHQEEIPERWIEYGIPFPGTVWRDSQHKGAFYMVYIFCCDFLNKRWMYGFEHLESMSLDFNCLLRLYRKS